MGQPYGDEIFRFDNSFGFLAKQDDGKLALEEGVCAALTAMWIRRCYETAGDVKALSEIGSRFAIELAQAAFEHGSSSKLDDEGAVLKPQGLKVISKGKIEHTEKRWHWLLTNMVFNPGMYWCGMEDDDGGHTVGFKTGGPNLSGYFCFDANEGLFKTMNQKEFASKNAKYLLEDYDDYKNVDWYRCTLG